MYLINDPYSNYTCIQIYEYTYEYRNIIFDTIIIFVP